MQLAKGYLIIVLKSKLGQKFSVENFDEENPKYKHHCPNEGKIFLSKNCLMLTGANFSGKNLDNIHDRSSLNRSKIFR